MFRPTGCFPCDTPSGRVGFLLLHVSTSVEVDDELFPDVGQPEVENRSRLYSRPPARVTSLLRFLQDSNSFLLLLE